ncbi:MAG TPA: PEP-CTERM sorting domain-containing protein [Bryobacteraceae bacterium]|nr:PEP-CTERM sorting domain-containing protein [Bryobacteraceae bacterium]
MIKRFFAMSVLAAVALLPATSFASTAGWEFGSVGTQSTDGAWNFGEVFTVNQNIMVNFLGYYNPTALANVATDLSAADTTNPTLVGSHEVALYDSAGNQLADTIIDNSSAFATTHWRYNPVAPVELFAGQTYVVQGLSGTQVYAYNDGGFTTFAPITILGNNWVLENTMSFNGTSLKNDVTDGYWGANFGFDPVTTPEPGSWMMIGTGLLGLAGLLRRKRSA